MLTFAYWLLTLLLLSVSCHAARPSFDLDLTFNKDMVANGKDAYDSHFDTIMQALSDYLGCDKKAMDATILSHDGLLVKVRFAISGKTEEEVAKVIDDDLHFLKLPLKLILRGVPVVSMDTVKRSWAAAPEKSTGTVITPAEPSTTAPIMNERPSFELDFTFNKDMVANGKDAYDSHFDTIMQALSDYLGCDKKAVDATILSHDGLSVKVRFAISGKTEEEVAKVIDDALHFAKLPLKLIVRGVPVVSIDTGNKSWADAPEKSTGTEITPAEPLTTAPIMNAYFHFNMTFSEEAGSNGAEAYERHRDAIQRVLADYLDCDKSAINATLISHTYMSAEVKFVITGFSERRVARKIDDDWHFLKLPLKFILNNVPVILVNTIKTSWERGSYDDSSSSLLTGAFMASILLLGTFF